ncbi:MAG: protein translocase subunit SecD [Armatimonadota bacterium]|nr:protein translocase subunit SecD [Armatimonadota bacterium]
MQKRGTWFVVVTLILVGLSAWINYGIKPRLGLDVAGGIRFTIRAELGELTSEERSGTAWASKANQTVAILERRASQGLGVAEANVYRKGSDKFIVELPGISNETEARSILTTSARLEYFWARNVATERDLSRPYEHTVVEEENEQGVKGPVDKFRRRGAADGEYITPGSPEWERMTERWELITTGDMLVGAQEQLGDNNRDYEIILSFKGEGAGKLNDFAAAHLNRKEYLAALMDDQVVSFASIADGTTQFTGGVVRLTGDFEAREAKQTANLLNAGALPVDLVEEDINTVAPSIGQQALSQILLAGGISFIIIAVFLVAYYVFAGFVALLALLAYISLSYAAFKWIGVTFSLAAIAGFILSVGMAVDANILIFERLKEELREGKGLLTAIELGFKRAFPAILDSNACTIITSAVLMWIGTGPVKGFATTLLIGVFISLFTAVMVTRALLLFLTGLGIGKNPKLYGTERGWFGERLEAQANEKPLPIVSRMKLYFIISGLIIVPGIIAIGMGGIKPNVEFSGGIESVVRLPEGSNLSAQDVAAKLEAAGFKGINAKIGDPERNSTRKLAYITLPPRDNPQIDRYTHLSEDPDVEKAKAELQTLRTEIGKRVVTAVGSDPTVTESGVKDEVSFGTASPSVRAETIRGAIIGVIASSILIVLWLAGRFGVALGSFVMGLRFGLSAILAMLHDVVVILGLSAIFGLLFNWEVSQLTITAMLTVIGFSVHDTIVIFDRIRENLQRPIPGEDFGRLVDRSITQSIARSLNTSGTVIVTLLILVLWGSATPDLKHFNAAMLIGIVSGTYSSIFNAAPILVLWERIVGRRKGDEHTILHDQTKKKPKRGPEIDEEATVWRDPSEQKPGYGQVKRKKR